MAVNNLDELALNAVAYVFFNSAANPLHDALVCTRSI